MMDATKPPASPLSAVPSTLDVPARSAPLEARQQPEAPRPAITLHIDRLLLDGLPLSRADGARLQVAMERELARLLGDGQLHQALSAGVALPVLRLSSIDLSRGMDPGQIGRALARVLHRGVAP
jgi:hypothetical protein